MNTYERAYSYLFIHSKQTYEDALLASKEALKSDDKRRFYVHATLLQSYHDDDNPNPPYIDPLIEGEAIGDPLSGILLAVLYQQGRSLTKHPAKAYDYFKKYQKQLETSAYEGEPLAQSLLGFLHQAGLFYKKDIGAAMRYYHQAQKQGLRIAYHQLGLLYQQKGPYEDIKKGKDLFQVVLDDKFVSSLFIKGLQSMKEKNDHDVIMYLEKAADLNYHHAMFSLGSYYMTQKQLEKAFMMFMRASELGHLKATYMVALAYASGKGVKKDEALSEMYLKIAADKGDMLSSYQLAANYMKKHPRPYVEIYEYLLVAAKKKHPLAIHNLGAMFLQGDGVLQDIKTALQYFEQGAALGVPISLFQAAKIYLEGVHVPKNEQKARAYLEQAAKKKYKPAQQLLETLERNKSTKPSYTA